MKRVVVAIAALIAANYIPASGRTVDTSLQAAATAWDRGDYAAALTTYLQVLDSPDADAALEEIALRTGELYRTTEITPDGAAPNFSPDGQSLIYETGIGPERVTRLRPVDATAGRTLQLPGFGAVFSPDGSKIAYLHVADSRNVADAQAALRQATPAERQQRLAALNRIIAADARIAVREIATDRETMIDTGTLRKTALAFAAEAVLFAGTAGDGGPIQIYSVTSGSDPVVRTSGPTDKTIVGTNAQGTVLLFTTRPAGQRAPDPGSATSTFGMLSISDDRTTMVPGFAPSFSGDGASFAYVNLDGADTRLMVADVSNPSRGIVVRHGAERLDAPALSRDGSRIAFQSMARDDWEIYSINRDGTGEARLTHDIQHDVLPVFLGADRILAVTGEPRHRRSFVYDVPSMISRRLFHNNTVRTIAPEYSWIPSRDGTRILITAERDGDTVSPERGVYLTDLTKRVTRAEVRARVKESLEAEQALRAAGQRMYAPIAAAVAKVAASASVERVYEYEKALFAFDSKYITLPGNKRAASYLFETYKSFGYAPEYQPFAFRLRTGGGGETANVVAKLTGTVNPEIVYVVSSHFDSAPASPGADDDSSGTAALLEAARILASHPQPATIMFASLTGEEAGLFGSAEFVRRALADKVHVAGALNNDMIGWANDFRLDETVRYSNAGIRDVQHAAAMQFTNLITYDAVYYKGTDAASYFDAYGDIVGGFGPYPVLSSPHYHQSHDVLETVNHRLVTEVAKTTAATLMLLASSPARLKDVRVERFTGNTATLSWTPSAEKGVTAYLVAYGPASKPHAQQVRVVKPSATLTGIAPGTVVSVKAVNAAGLEGWDWARVTVK